jgi:sulfur-oxidizing protein SoxX
MINKTLFAALLAATTLVPGIPLAADADTKASGDQSTTGKATTDKASSGKAATGKSSEGKSGSAKASGEKAGGGKEKAAAGKGDAGKTGGKPTAAAKADAPKVEGAKPEPDQGAGGKAAAPAAVGAAVGAAGAAGIAAAAGAGSQVDYTKMSPAELTEYLIFDAKGFKLDQPTQEGKTGKERMTQDELQKACSALRGNPVDAATAQKVQALAVASHVYPEGGITLGDWKKGEALAKEGAGFRMGPKADDNKKLGGNCYACHQMDLKVSAHGTIGPTLTGFGKNRGNTPETQKYVYEVIYNAHAYFPCTNMPRFGANGFLNQEQIADLMAYLLNPESPVNH